MEKTRALRKPPERENEAQSGVISHALKGEIMGTSPLAIPAPDFADGGNNLLPRNLAQTSVVTPHPPCHHEEKTPGRTYLRWPESRT